MVAECSLLVLSCLAFESTVLGVHFHSSSELINDVERTLRALFWKGPGLQTSWAKIKWASVCVSKKGGGLAFKVFR